MGLPPTGFPIQYLLGIFLLPLLSCEETTLGFPVSWVQRTHQAGPNTSGHPESQDSALKEVSNEWKSPHLFTFEHLVQRDDKVLGRLV